MIGKRISGPYDVQETVRFRLSMKQKYKLVFL